MTLTLNFVPVLCCHGRQVNTDLCESVQFQKKSFAKTSSASPLEKDIYLQNRTQKLELVVVIRVIYSLAYCQCC